MKFSSRIPAAALVLAGCFTASSVFAQAPAGGKTTVKIDDIKVGVQKTPDFALKGGTTDKRVRPKDWIEIEPVFKVSAPKAAGKDAKAIPELVFKYYVFLNSASASGEKKILTTEVTHVNIPIGEELHSVVYVSPSTIMRVTGKAEGNVNLVSGCAVEVTSGGETVGFWSKFGGATVTDASAKNAKWWDAQTAPPKEPDLLNKSQSPFAPLWADYYADVKGVK